MAPVIAQAEFLYAAAALKGPHYDWIENHQKSLWSATNTWTLHVLRCMSVGGVQSAKRDRFVATCATMGVRTDGQSVDFTFKGCFVGKQKKGSAKRAVAQAEFMDAVVYMMREQERARPWAGI